MARLIVKSLLLLVSTLFACLPAYPQDSTSKRLVLHVTVSDDKQRAVQGLTQNAFSVTVDKTPQSITGFSDADVPASVGVLVDDSSSMRKGNKKNTAIWRARLLEGLSQFSRNSHPENEYFAVVFGDTALGLSDWTSEISKLQELIPPFRGEGKTALYDVCDRAVRKLQTGRYQKQILFLLTDGVDSSSKVNFNQLRDQLLNSDVAVYPIVITGGSDLGSSLAMEGEAAMMELADITGGRTLVLPTHSTPAIVSDLFTTLAREIRSQYQLILNPQIATDKKPKARKIKVLAVRSDSSGKPGNLRTRTRQALIQ